MADTPTPPAKSGSFGFLSRKIGPVPIWLIGVVGFGAYYWWSHRKAAAAPAAAAPGRVEVVEVHGPPGPRGRPGPAGNDVDKVTVPNVVGTTYTQGGEEIKRAGLIAQRSAPYIGKVRSESPHAGTRLERGSTVTLRGRQWPPPKGPQPQASQPVRAAAPQTAAAVYGTDPTATPSGQTYDSGDVASVMGAGLAVAG